MRIDVLLSPGDWAVKSPSAGRVVVIDVLRASTSIITALANGAEQILPAASREEALSMGRSLPAGRVLFCGERGGLIIEGFDLGNSPREYTAARVNGKILVFASTNGSRMIVESMAAAKKVLVAGFVNAGAAANQLAASTEDVLLACSGRDGSFSMEDAVCAGMLVERVRREAGGSCELTDEARACVLMHRHYADDLAGMAAGSVHGRYLTGLGLGDDLPVCVSTDAYPTVPQIRGGVLVSG
jgi:2-phosphosulfolactate phosphatase